MFTLALHWTLVGLNPGHLWASNPLFHYYRAPEAVKCKCKKCNFKGCGLVVNVLAFYSDYLSLNPAGY